MFSSTIGLPLSSRGTPTGNPAGSKGGQRRARPRVPAEVAQRPVGKPRITSSSAPPPRAGEHWWTTSCGPCTEGTRTAGTWSANRGSPHCAAPLAPHAPGRTFGRRRVRPAESYARSQAHLTVRAERLPVVEQPAHAVAVSLLVSLGRCHGGNH
ncbi:hypothetical protein CU044_1887 [Streptomyces sp. L-9-10]|nr:hypothetical protein CU044_1887 [Streptomyces sp. L-9-10]